MTANNFISTPTVAKFYFNNPNPDDIYIMDIAHALSLICRFGGHCDSFYSVAEHSIILGTLLEKDGADDLTLLAALLHDAEEAYLPDIPRPIKAMMPEADKIYEHLSQAIDDKYLLQGASWSIIYDYDRRLCITEAKALGIWNEEWEDAGPSLPAKLFLWKPEEAEQLFINNFVELSEKCYNFTMK